MKNSLVGTLLAALVTASGCTDSKPHTVKISGRAFPRGLRGADCTQTAAEIVDRDGKPRDYKTGTCWANLTYGNEDGGTEQISCAELCWSKTLTACKGVFLSISAQNDSSSGGVTVLTYIERRSDENITLLLTLSVFA